MVIRQADEKIDVFGDTALVSMSAATVPGSAITPVVPANYPPDQTIVRKYIKGHAQS